MHTANCLSLSKSDAASGRSTRNFVARRGPLHFRWCAAATTICQGKSSCVIRRAWLARGAYLRCRDPGLTITSLALMKSANARSRSAERSSRRRPSDGASLLCIVRTTIHASKARRNERRSESIAILMGPALRSERSRRHKPGRKSVRSRRSTCCARRCLSAIVMRSRR